MRCRGGVFGDDGLAVARGVGRDMRRRVLHAVHDLYGQNVIQKFGVEILRPGGRAGNDGRGAGQSRSSTCLPARRAANAGRNASATSR